MQPQRKHNYYSPQKIKYHATWLRLLVKEQSSEQDGITDIFWF